MGAITNEIGTSTRAKVARRSPWRRIAVGLGIAAASVVVLYVVAINLFLRTGLLRNALGADPVAFRVEYKSAYSIVPGRIHVGGLTIRGRDSSIEWMLALDDCDFRVAFRDLFHKRFHAFHIRANGFAIRVRLRIPRAEVTPEVVAALPPIAGFADPPYAGAKTAPLTDANYNLWMVQLDDVDVQHVREVWIHTVRSEGDTRVRGRWVFRPLRWLEVGPASVDVATLDVSTGNRPLATGLHGSIDATVHPFDLRKPQGLEILEYLSTQTRLVGTAIDSNLLTTVFAKGAGGVRFTRAEGPVDVQLLVDHGRLRSGTRVRAESADTEVTVEKLVFDASIRAELDVDEDSATFRARGSDCRASASAAVRAKAASVEATIVTHHLDAAHAFDDSVFAVAIHRAETNDLARWQARYFPSSGVVVRADLVTLEGAVHGSVAPARAQGDLELAARRFAAARGADKISGDVAGRIELRDLRLADGFADMSGSRVALANARATWRGVDAQAPIVSLQAPRALVHVLTTHRRTGEPAVGPLPPDVDFDLVLPRAEVSDLREINAVLPASAAFVTMAGRASVSGRLFFSVSAQRASGFATIAGDDVTARVGPAIVEGKLVAHVALREWAVADRTFELSRSDLVLRDVSVRGNLTAQRTADVLTVPSLRAVTTRLAIAPRGNEGIVSLDMPSATIVDLRTLASVGALPAEISVQGGQLGASMHVDADLGSGAANGDARIVAHDLKARFGSTIATAGLTVDVKARRDASETSGLAPIDLSGSKVAITDGGIGPGQGSWRGTFELADAILHTGDGSAGAQDQHPGVDFEAQVHGTATDASPAAALVADNAGVPAWAANMFRMPNLHVDGEVRATGSSLELRSLAAQGGGASVRMEYAKRGALQNGAVLMDLGWVEMGYDLTAGSTGLVVLGSEGWFNRKSAMIRAGAPSPAGTAQAQQPVRHE